MATTRLERALAAIDEANRGDPNTLEVRGALRPKELAHAELMSESVAALWHEHSGGEALSDALQLAARAHHIQRWSIARSGYPEGAHGYRSWRIALQKRHAELAGEILEAQGYEPELVARVQRILQKKGLRSDPEVQVYEDALCLVFVETQLAALASQHDDAKMIDIIRKTLRKMSPAGVAAAQAIPVGEHARELIAAAAREL